MTWWPWGGTEIRASSVTDALIQQIVSQAGGKATATPAATGALEAAAGMVSRCFAAATVHGPAHLAVAVTPAILSTIGRALIRRGELVLAIDVDPLTAAVRLLPASTWDIQGDYNPDSWWYRVDLAGPSRYATRSQLPAAAVVHPRYQIDPDRPWRGVGPLQSASLAGRLSAETTAALADAESGPRGSVLPLPVDGDDPTVVTLKSDIRTLAGKMAFVESVRSMHPGAAGNAPRDDWQTKRIGADPPAGEVELFTQASIEVLNACGVPPSLFAIGEGTAQRESFRRMLHSTIQPLGRLVSGELSAKLDAEISLSFDTLFAADLSGRARAFQSMVKGGMDVSKAAGLAGLMESEAS